MEWELFRLRLLPNKIFMSKVEQKIIIPTIEGLKKKKITYKGFIFIGLMKVDDEPYVIEYNVRMGDPETEVVVPRINNDLLDLFLHVENQTLDQVTLAINSQVAATVMLVSKGYPEAYEKEKSFRTFKTFKTAMFSCRD